MKILALETSCDETAICLLEANQQGFEIHQNLVSSQVKIHAKYGGIVPEVAARKHVEVLPLLLEQIFGNLKSELRSRNYELGIRKHEVRKQKLRSSEVDKPDIIAVTTGPGLITSLMVGVETAKTLSFAWKKPLVAVNHLEGHIYSNWLTEKEKDPSAGSGWPKIKFPALCLIVSGGHTQLVLMKNHQKYQIIGETQDDAAGEAFDKVAKLLNLGYPGGPVISKWASLAESRAERGRRRAEKNVSLGFQTQASPAKRNVKLGLKIQPNVPEFPRPLLNKPSFDFSFSGLKTSVLYFLQKQNVSLGFSSKGGCASGAQTQASPEKMKYPSQLKIAVAREFQNAVVEVLVKKTIKAAKKYGVKTLMIAGGVAANQELRKQFVAGVSLIPNSKFLIPNSRYCGDNAAMIAVAGYFQALKKNFTPFDKVKIDPNWQL